MSDRWAAAEDAARVDLAKVEPFALGAAEVSPALRRIAWPDRSEPVEPRVMRVLVALHRAGGAVLTRDDLIASCWDGVVVGEDAINRTLGRLRRLSEVDGGASFVVETLPRVGYRLLGGAGPATETITPPREQGRARWAWLAAIALLLAVLGGIGVLVWREARRAREEPPLVAVLPLDAAAADQASADALALTLADGLSRSGLRVISASSTFRFRGAAKADAGKMLGARYVVDGAVLARTAEGPRLSLRVDDVAGRVTVWSRTFDGDAGRVDTLAERAAAALVSAIAWPGARLAMDSGQAMDATGVTLFLRSTEADRRGEYLEALAAARQLLAHAPDLPLAQANLAIVTGDALGQLPPGERAQAVADARAAAERATRHAPRHGEARVGLALLQPRTRWAAREAQFRKAISVDPDNGAAHIYYAAFLQDAGRANDSLAELARARAMDPLSDSILDRSAVSLAMAGQATAARALLDDGRAKWPDRPGQAVSRMRLAAMLGDGPAMQALLDDPELGPMFAARGFTGPLGAVAAALRRPTADTAQAAIVACRPAMSIYLARICVMGLAQVGRLDEAFRLLDAQTRAPAGEGADAEMRAWLSAPERGGVLTVLYAPATRGLRADPRAAAVFQRLGLAGYWRRTGRWPDFCTAEPGSVCRAWRR